MTQARLADASEVNIRTIQRAEGGAPVTAETIAALAGTMNIPATDLLMDTAEATGHTLEKALTLKKVSSGRALVEHLHATRMCHIDCDVEPTPDNLPALKSVIELIEASIPDPLDEDKLVWPPRASLVRTLELVAGLNGLMTQLSDLGLAIFAARRVEWAIVPWYDGEEGHLCTRHNQSPEQILTLRLLISHGTTERITVDVGVQWPIDVVEPPRAKAGGMGALAGSFEDDLDDDLPF